MLDIYTLRDIATNVAQGLKATREGNTAALEQAIAAASKGLQGMDVASQTRQRIQQTQQAKTLFPSALTTAEEGATQAGQQTALGAVDVAQAERGEGRLAEAFKMLDKAGITYDTKTALAAFMEARDVEIGKARMTEPSIAKEAKGLELGTELDVAEKKRKLGLQPIMSISQRRMLEMAPVEKQADIQLKSQQIQQIAAVIANMPKQLDIELKNLKARFAEIEARKQLLTNQSEKLEREQEKAQLLDDFERRHPGIKDYMMAVESKLIPAAPELQDDIRMLEVVKQRIRTGASVEDIVNEVGTEQQKTPDSLENMRKRIQFLMPAMAQRAISKEADKRAAITAIESLINLYKAMEQRHVPEAFRLHPKPEPKPILPDGVKQGLLEELNRLFPTGE